MRRSQQVVELQTLIRPFMLRRMKESVETSIPLKQETIVDVELTGMQKLYYRAIYERNAKVRFANCDFLVVRRSVCQCSLTLSLLLF